MSGHKSEGGVDHKGGLSPVSVVCTRLSSYFCFYIFACHCVFLLLESQPKKIRKVPPGLPSSVSVGIQKYRCPKYISLFK